MNEDRKNIIDISNTFCFYPYLLIFGLLSFVMSVFVISWFQIRDNLGRVKISENVYIRIEHFTFNFRSIFRVYGTKNDDVFFKFVKAWAFRFLFHSFCFLLKCSLIFELLYSCLVFYSLSFIKRSTSIICIDFSVNPNNIF